MRLPLRFWLLAFALSAAIILAGGIVIAHARPSDHIRTPPPTTTPAVAKARHACPGTTTIVQCRGKLVRAYKALEWQRKARRDAARRADGYGVQHALKLASALYSVPLGEMRVVASCESHMNPSSQNQSSTAAGLFQFLDGTWTRAGVPGFSVFDAYANAIAAARLVRSDGSWREWSCAP